MGSITGVRFFKGPENTGTHTVSLWTTAGTRLATATATNESSTGWQTALFATPVNVTANTTYVVSYLAPNAKYSSVSGGLAAALDVGPLHTSANAGRYLYGPGYPSNSWSASYMVDPVFTTSVAPADTTAPVISVVAASTSGSTATITWTTDEASSSTVSYGTTSTLGSTATGSSGTSHSVTITGLTSGATYSYRVTSADAAGNSADSPAAPAAPATFTAADTVAPSISAVAVTGSGSSRTITWTTDESATQLGGLRDLVHVVDLQRHRCQWYEPLGHPDRSGPGHDVLLPGHLGRPGGQQRHLAGDVLRPRPRSWSRTRRHRRSPR